MVPLHRWLAPTALLLLVACAAPIGNLQIDVAGVPNGEQASITVTGPGNYVAAVTESTTLTGLTPGTYELQAAQITTTAITSEYISTITPQSLDVVAGETNTASVQYALRAGTLAISISGLPAGEDADASVSGPDAFTQDVTTSAILDVPPGEYFATANPVIDGTDTYTPTITGSPAEVSSAAGAGIDITYQLQSGGLDITINGLPAGLDADVLLEGTNGFQATLTMSESFPNLPPGRYSVTINSVSMGLSTYQGPNTTVEVTSNTTTNLDLTYELLPGTLKVAIAGLPGSVDTDVLIEIEGPAGFSATLTSSTTLTDLVLGEYKLTTTRVRTIDPIVSELYDPTDPQPQTLEVSSGTNTVTSTYAVIPSSGRLWTPHNAVSTTIVTGIAAKDLVSSGSPTPAATITGANVLNEGIAFDGAGNAWITHQAGSPTTLERYLAADLATDGSPSPSVTISGLNGPLGLAFDPAGNLWVANGRNDTVVGFRPDQLLEDGSPVPAVTISDDGSGSLDLPAGLAFDAAGNLWVANFSGHTVVRFGADQLTASGAPEPEVTIDDGAGGNLNFPAGLAFDAAGALWVTNRSPTVVLKFESPGSLSGNQNPTPDVVLSVVVNPAAVAFDEGGSLWVSNDDLFRFDDPGSLAGAVSPAADAVIDPGPRISFGLFAFFPPPVHLPITTP